MKKNKFISIILGCLLGGLIFNSCTNLEETTYNKIVSSNFYQTKDDVYRSFLRTFEHGYWTVQGTQFFLQEDPADQLMTPNRQGDWYDGGSYFRLHYHTWTPTDGFCNDAWNNLFVGVSLANNSLEDIRALDVSKFNMTSVEQKMLVAELRTMRAWYYLRLFDLYRNIPIVETTKGASQSPLQAPSQETFNFIEKELKEAVVDLGKKGDASMVTSRWTQAGAMSLLSRLYLNSKVYTGVDKFADCAAICQDIIDGKYGSYGIASRWDAPYDWNNDMCEETIFAFPGSFGRTHWQYEGGMYWWALPYNVNKYFEFTDFGNANPKYTLQPGRDVAGNLYNFTSNLGQPFVKFQKYADDVRLTLYKNLGNNTREGMFLYGYLICSDGSKVQTTKGYDLYIRDQVGIFNNLAPGQIPSDLTSTMNTADQNSGVYFVKYPFYKTTDTHKIESDFSVIRLAEVYYSLAECKFRSGDKAGAEKLLNIVRKRYYPAGSSSLYPEDGSRLTESELLDEWGREFLGEGRRRTDLIRFGKFNTGIWWDKSADADNHTEIFPIGETVLGVSSQLKQNPGY